MDRVKFVATLRSALHLRSILPFESSLMFVRSDFVTIGNEQDHALSGISYRRTWVMRFRRGMAVRARQSF